MKIPALLRVPFVFGAAAGALCFAFFVALHLLGVVPVETKRFLDFGFYIIMMAACNWYYRKKIGNGYLHLWQGISIGYLIVIVGSLLTGFLIYVFYSLNPEAFSAYLDATRALLLSQKIEYAKRLGEAEFQRDVASVATIKPSGLVFNELKNKFFLAIIPILVISLLFRKQDYGVFQQ